MTPLHLMKRGIVALLLILTFVLQGTTSVLAGTTGGITGTVIDPTSSQPVAGARVTATSPSQAATTTSDGAGRFSFVSLTPDTYTVTAAATATRDEASVSGITVIADSSQTVSIGQPTKLKVIGSVTSRANSALVKPGTTADVYSISAAQQDKAAVFSGGGTLNSAWSAITSVPGVYIAPNRAGYIGAGPQVSIRGGDYNQIGYELDGIPVNRSFDNYPSNQLSSLGEQELQVYTGATPANAEANGISGYINQVIRTGTAPAYRLLDVGIGTPTFYNKLSFETGGANPSRTFSYYLGAGLYNQNYRYVDQFNSAAVSQQWGTPVAPCGPKATPSLAPSCYGPNGQDYTNGGTTKAYVLGSYALDNLSTVRDRDDIVNLHFGIPRRDGNKDDVQLLWDYGHFSSNFYNSPNDQGGLAYLNAIGAPAPIYVDGYQFVGYPLGTLLPQSYAGGGSILYGYPQSPLGRPLNATIAPNFRDGSSNDQAILKLQYQRNFGTNAFLRVYGYTNYSDWLENNPLSVTQNYSSAGPSDYDVMNHTRGVSATFSDQVTQQHLVTLQGSYTTANSIRNNNTEMLNGLSGPNAVSSRTVVGVLVDSSNPTNGICYKANGTPAPNCGFASGGQFFTLQQAYGLGAGVTPATGTCGGGPCQYLVGGNGLFSTFNGVTPKFYAVSLTDNWKPTDRLNINFGIRFDRFTFQGQDTRDTAARDFWYAAYNRDNGTNIQNVPSQIEAYNEWQPRVGFTYTLDSKTVIRGSYGRYAEAPNAAFEQYNYLQANDVASLATFGNFGLPTTPGHDVRPQVSNNYDFSLEKQLSRDLSFKLTPFYRKTQDQIQQFYLDQKTSFVSGLNVGKQTSEGVELAVDKGDFARDGVSARLSFTYTNSYINYTLVPNGTTIVDPINLAIKGYNAYTAAGGGAPCYKPAASKTTPGAADPACAAGSIANPYYNAPIQGLLDPNANYPTFTTFPGPVGVGYNGYGAPYITTLLVQWKRGALALAPAIQFSAGQRYGAPENTGGIQPNLCTAALAGVTPGTDPRYNYGAPGGTSYDATKCATGVVIPDQFTNRFDGIGAFVRPSSLQVHLQASYDVNRRLQLVGNFTNLLNRCFGGTKVGFAVTNACGYAAVNGAGSGPAPVGNAYNPGATIQPFLATPYNPTFVGFPFNFYLEGRLKL